MIKLDATLTPRDLRPAVERLFDLSASKITRLNSSWNAAQGTPVFTVGGKYTSRGWTEWTQGFQFGAAILQFDATGDRAFLALGRDGTVKHMASHVSHIGVHDHGFNNVSTYGNLLRLMREGKIPDDQWEKNFYELALKVSGAVQAARWTQLDQNAGYIYSFNGRHSLFADTVRSLRALAVAHQLGHVLMGEKDRRISLLERLILHAAATAQFSVYYGKGRDAYDIRGRVAHESIFNINDGSYRCPNSQQGYSPFTTWTRGLAWIVCGFAEQLEFLATLPETSFTAPNDKKSVLKFCLDAATASADFYIQFTPTDGVPYWDTGAPGLSQMGDYLNRPSDPFNDFEPVDSSAAAIAAQGLLRLGQYLETAGDPESGKKYRAAGLTTAKTIFREPYLSTKADHEGLLLHSIYHRPNGWDFIPEGKKIPSGESSMWGDYHARELGLFILRLAKGEPYLRFFL